MWPYDHFFRYTAENSVKFGAPRDTDNPELRQPSAQDVWNSVVESLDPRSKITILTNGPLTNLAQIIQMPNASSLIQVNNIITVIIGKKMPSILNQTMTFSTYISFLMQGVYIVGGHIDYVYDNEKGNLFTVSSNEHAEFNMFLDPVAAKEVFASSLDITLVPLHMQRRVSSFSTILNRMNGTTQTPESVFAQRLLLRLWGLQQQHYRYHHMVN